MAASGPTRLAAARAGGALTVTVALTQGRGVDYAIDGIGGKMLAKTLACVRRHGVVASIGQVAGPVFPQQIDALVSMRAITLTRPSVMAYATEHDAYVRGAASVLEMIGAGVRAPLGSEYALADAARAHADLEAGRTTGSLLLIP